MRAGGRSTRRASLHGFRGGAAGGKCGALHFRGTGYLSMALTAEPPRARRSERVNRPADQQGGSGRMQDRGLGNVVDPAAFTGQPAKGRFRGGL
jgi:hypothetical protein